MKFKPFPHRLRRLDFNQRKASLFERKQQREANALPLFAEMIRAEQHDWETEKEIRQRRDDATLINWRAREARVWRKARSMFFALPSDDRASVIRDWNTIWRNAWTPTNLIYLVEKYNGVEAQREAAMREERQQMDVRIMARLSHQQGLF
ncbi:hypothetical protein BANRA_06185 [Pseudomonas aeruginosa]|uniref:hypothetical protein n=1 Tax=Pseudomonas TaxID=286 RepID=UPI00071BBF9C|nr:hypothetical protein [Pseudomonas aeruginosa]KSP81272.1 hypothetical protein APB20_19775 [Pseudomonas aeruginosa]VCZ31517.1 hypothetical protein BANRA_06185 [Pseudomonas aeruginosa]